MIRWFYEEKTYHNCVHVCVGGFCVRVCIFILAVVSTDNFFKREQITRNKFNSTFKRAKQIYAQIKKKKTNWEEDDDITNQHQQKCQLLNGTFTVKLKKYAHLHVGIVLVFVVVMVHKFTIFPPSLRCPIKKEFNQGRTTFRTQI